MKSVQSNISFYLYIYIYIYIYIYCNKAIKEKKKQKLYILTPASKKTIIQVKKLLYKC